MTTGPSTSESTGWRHVYSGKVRDLYERADAVADPASARGVMLLVASDRVSAFDHVLSPAIDGKGAALTRISRWWFDLLDVPDHRVDPADAGVEIPASVAERAMLVRTLSMYPIECVVRGYLTGSGWKEYQASGTVCGVALPAGLTDGDRLPEPIYTPAWKAPLGQHDENIDFARTVELVGPDAAAALRDASLAIFTRAAEVAEARGILLADTKFEFGENPDGGAPVLADEVLTPDSSRYWDAAAYAEGRRGVSFDKQIVRDWLAANWDGEGTPPPLPPEVVARTAARYDELEATLTS